MTLYSLGFITLFLPLAAVILNTLPQKLRAAALSLFSLTFYLFAAGEHAYLLPLLTLLVYGISFIGRNGFFICLLLFLPLRFFGINEIGISFFILRSAAYVYDGKCERNFFKVFAFLMFFPTVHAGPLARYEDFRKGFRRSIDYGKISCGICKALYGAFKKLFFADALYEIFFSAYGGETSLSALISLLAYSLYIYFDFSGCSDMACGIAATVGFDIPRNFDFPYMSRSVGEFFRRWHITLGEWLRDYVYIPLGGSKNGKLRTAFSLFAVWLASAMWHGFTASYLLWGMYFFALCAAEKLILQKGFKCGRLCTFLLVLFGWVFFFSPTPLAAFAFFERLFCIDSALFCRADIYTALHSAPFLLVSALFATPLPRRICGAVYARAKAVVYLAAVPLFLLILSCILSSGHIPFLYASF